MKKFLVSAVSILALVSMGGVGAQTLGDPHYIAYPRGTTTRLDDAIAAAVASDAGKQPGDADLTSLAGATSVGTIYYRSATSTWSPVTIGTGLSFSGGTLTNTVSGGGSGTVSSVGLTSTDFAISGSPVTSSGNITANLASSITTAHTWIGIQTISTAVPQLRFVENDQTDPAGNFRFFVNGDSFNLQHATSTNFGSVVNVLAVDGPSQVLDFTQTPTVNGTSVVLTNYGLLTGAAQKSNNLSDLGNISSARTNLGLVIGTNVQAYDADLDCYAGLTTTGFLKHTGVGACSSGTLATGDIPDLSATYLTPTAGNAAYLGLTAQAADSAKLGGVTASSYLTSATAATTYQPVNGNLSSISTVAIGGFLTRSATNTITPRTLSAGTGTTVTNGDGVSGNPSVNITYGAAVNTAAQGNDGRITGALQAANNLSDVANATTTRGNIKAQQASINTGNGSDANSTYAVAANGATYLFTFPLTANRFLNLSATGGYDGLRLRVVFTGTGGFTLTVRDQTITTNAKALAINQWTDFDFSTSCTCWKETAFGSL